MYLQGTFALFYVNHTLGNPVPNFQQIDGVSFDIDGFGGVYTLVVGITDSVLADKAVRIN